MIKRIPIQSTSQPYRSVCIVDMYLPTSGVPKRLAVCKDKQTAQRWVEKHLNGEAVAFSEVIVMQ